MFTGNVYTHRFHGVDCTDEECMELGKIFKIRIRRKEWPTEEELVSQLKILRDPKNQYAVSAHQMFTASPEPQVADSVAATLAQRGSRYGDFTDHAELAQGLMFRMQTFCKSEPVTLEHPEGYIVPWKDKLNNVQRQALTVIADKIARILSGDPNYDDNWHDIQGYAKLVEDRLPKKE